MGVPREKPFPKSETEETETKGDKIRKKFKNIKKSPTVEMEKRKQPPVGMDERSLNNLKIQFKKRFPPKGVTPKKEKNVEPSPPTRKPGEQKEMQPLSRGGRAGYKSGSKGCKLAMKGKGRAYGKNS
jgi:hypothetical protein